MAIYYPKVIRKQWRNGRIIEARTKIINGVKYVLHATKGWRKI